MSSLLKPEFVLEESRTAEHREFTPKSGKKLIKNTKISTSQENVQQTRGKNKIDAANRLKSVAKDNATVHNAGPSKAVPKTVVSTILTHATQLERSIANASGTPGKKGKITLHQSNLLGSDQNSSDLRTSKVNTDGENHLVNSTEKAISTDTKETEAPISSNLPETASTPRPSKPAITSNISKTPPKSQQSNNRSTRSSVTSLKPTNVSKSKPTGSPNKYPAKTTGKSTPNTNTNKVNSQSPMRKSSNTSSASTTNGRSSKNKEVSSSASQPRQSVETKSTVLLKDRLDNQKTSKEEMSSKTADSKTLAPEFNVATSKPQVKANVHNDNKAITANQCHIEKQVDVAESDAQHTKHVIPDTNTNTNIEKSYGEEGPNNTSQPLKPSPDQPEQQRIVYRLPSATRWAPSGTVTGREELLSGSSYRQPATHRNVTYQPLHLLMSHPSSSNKRPEDQDKEKLIGISKEDSHVDDTQVRRDFFRCSILLCIGFRHISHVYTHVHVINCLGNIQFHFCTT